MKGRWKGQGGIRRKKQSWERKVVPLVGCGRVWQTKASESSDLSPGDPQGTRTGEVRSIVYSSRQSQCFWSREIVAGGDLWKSKWQRADRTSLDSGGQELLAFRLMCLLLHWINLIFWSVGREGSMLSPLKTSIFVKFFLCLSWSCFKNIY